MTADTGPRPFEELFPQFSDATSEGVVVHRGGVVIAANRAFADLFGFEETEDAIGTTILDLVASQSRDAIIMEGIRLDGRPVLFRTTSTPVEFDGERARAVTARNVIEDSDAEAALREATERFRLAFEGAPIGIALVGTDGRWLQVNPALSEIVGYSAEELSTRTFQDITHPDDLETDLALMHQVLAGETSSYSMEKRYFHADGHVVWINLSVGLVRDPDGRPLYFISQIEDITDRKRVTATVALLERVAVAANEASSADEAYATTLEVVCEHTGWPVGHVYVLTCDGTGDLVSTGLWHLDDAARFESFRLVSDEARWTSGDGLPGRVLETGRAEWVGSAIHPMNLRQAVGVELGLRAAFAFPVLVGRDVVAVFEFFGENAADPDDELLEVMANVGTQLGRVVERARLTEQQEELDTARARFVANAAHELRTPLATLRSVAGLLGTRRDELTADEVAECFDMLDRQGRHLEALVKDLLDLSSIEHGELAVPGEVSPVEVWIPAALELAPAPDGVAVATRLDHGITVAANTDRLIRVLVNLLTNAYRYGGPSVVVSARRDGNEAVVTVEDDGDGVPDGLVGELFEPFTRAGGHPEGGSGLGLAISRRIVEHFGGRITYEARDGGGARFVVRLPAAS